MIICNILICFIALLTIEAIELNKTILNNLETKNIILETNLKIGSVQNSTSTIKPVGSIGNETNQIEKKKIISKKRKGNKCKRVINSKLLHCNQTEYRVYIECVRKNEEIKLKVQRTSNFTEYIDKLSNTTDYLLSYNFSNEKINKTVFTRKRGLNLSKEQQLIESRNQNSLNENDKLSCCHIVYPRECIKIEEKTKCFNRRRRTCGPHCVSNVVYTQTKTNCEGSNCRKQTTYISKRTTPRCTFLPQWPFIHCAQDIENINSKDQSNTLCPYHLDNTIPVIVPTYVQVLVPYYSLYQALPWLNQPLFNTDPNQNRSENCNHCKTQVANPTNPCSICKSCGNGLCSQSDANSSSEKQAIEISLERNSNSYL